MSPGLSAAEAAAAAVLPGGIHTECKAKDGADAEACSREAEDVGLLQLPKHDWSAAGVALTTDSCTGGNADPYASGSHRSCCSGLQECLRDWLGSGTWSYKCVASCSGKEPGPPPAGTGLSTCPKAVKMDASRSIWNVAASSQSCHSSQGIRGDAGFACADAEGSVDHSSIYVDMGSVQNKVGCFVWETDECQYKMKGVKQIDFDVEWEDCSNLWMAPLWTFSSPWAPDTKRQGLSGEIDFVEECPVPSVNTNLGCYNAGQGNGCVDTQHWGESSSSKGPKHMRMTLDSAGSLEVQVCDLDRRGCRSVASYRHYLHTVYPTTSGRDNLYKFMSDIFNDHGGDGGWSGCKASRNPSTRCRYAITNIQIESRSGAPVFSDPHSKCFALNARASVAASSMPMGLATPPQQAAEEGTPAVRRTQ